jgi:NAD(P)-dependent dehydrogenase (short-subunit alcohol dehydrogenase family)
MSEKWSTEEIPDQSGRVAVVTGANSGLGLISGRELARHGAHVIMGCRSCAKGEQAAGEIRAAAPGAELDVRELDLSSQDSVRAFAEQVTADHPRIDLLVNNGGIMAPPRTTTDEGWELQLATNHLGHFALTGLLLDALRAGDRARVVTVSSLEHRPGKMKWDDLHREHGYNSRAAYQQSKLANALFGLELDRRLRAAGESVISVLAHPGWTATNLQTTGPVGLRQRLYVIGNRLVAQGVEEGALPQLYAATMPGVQGGEFICPDGFYEIRGNPTRTRASRNARDEDDARRLWEVSEELTGVTYKFGAPAPA